MAHAEEKKSELLQRVKRDAYLIIGRTFAVIRFNFGPRNSSRPVNYVNRRMRNAVKLSAFISGVAQPVGIDDLVFRIG